MTDFQGWAGATLLLLAYGLNNFEKFPRKSRFYHFLNFIGAIFLSISAASHNAKPLLALNSIWTFIAFAQLVTTTLSVNIQSRLPNPILETLWRGIPRPDSEEMDKLAAAQRANQAANNVDKDLINHLYGCLSSIDTKSGALLTNNSLWLAVIAIFSSSENFGFDKGSPWELLCALSAFVLIFTSSALALITIYIRWSSSDELNDQSLLARTLLTERANRTIRLRVAIISSGLGAFILTTYVFIKYLKPLSDLNWGFN